MFGLNKKDSQNSVLPSKQFDHRDLLTLILENTPIVLTIFNKEGIYTYTKGKALAGVHHADGESVGKSIFEMYGKYPEIVEAAQRSLKGEVCAFTVDVKGAWFQTVFVPQKNDEGEVLEVYGIATDVTQIQKDKAALEKAKNEMETILDSVADPLFVKNEGHTCVFVNKAYCDFVGHTKEELIGKSDYDFFPKSEVDIFWKHDDLVFSTNTEDLNEEKFTNAQGVVKTILTKKIAYTDKYGQRFLVGTIRDVTEAKQVEEIIKASEVRFREMFDTISNGVIIYDVVDNGEDYIIKECNLAAASMTNLKRSEMVGKRVTKLFPKLKEFGLIEIFKRVWLTGKKETMPRSFYQDNRFSIWVENKIYKMPSGQVVAIIDDVTKQRESEEKVLSHTQELEELNKVMTGRELKMIELKDKIKELQKLLDEKK